MFRRYPELEQVILFGSRATGRATEWSDIDLATRGIVDRHRLGRLSLDLDEIAIPQECEVLAYEQIDSAPLKTHIDRWGVPIYEAGAGAGLQSAVSSAERGTAAPHTSPPAATS